MSCVRDLSPLHRTAVHPLSRARRSLSFDHRAPLMQVNLSVPDIEKILDTLIYDGKVERRLQAGGGVQEQLKLYRATQTLLPPVGLVKTPCGICPVGGAPSACVKSPRARRHESTVDRPQPQGFYIAACLS